MPGVANPTDGFHFMATSVYIVTGLAVLAMSFDLMQESIREKFNWFVLHLYIYVYINFSVYLLEFII